MCGIVGIISQRKQEVVPRLVESLKRLEYRGYDSAGVAVLSHGDLEIVKSVGKIVNLEAKLKKTPLEGFIGIAHTRWATHGIPSEKNAHPHATDRVAVVHNGIIENFQTLRKELEDKGCVLQSETDTEVIAHSITSFLQEGMTPVEAFQKTLKRLEGAYALAVLIRGEESLLLGARKGSPLAVGYGEEEVYLGSDALALASLTKRLSYLEDGDSVVIEGTEVTIYDASNQEVLRPVTVSTLCDDGVSKGDYDHYMLKEIHEQPQVVRRILSHYLSENHRNVVLGPLPFALQNVPRITIVACGTAFYAGLVARYWFEDLAGVPVDLDIASEFRYRQPPLDPEGLAIFISQSGETADTLAALGYAKSQGVKTIGIVNVEQSSLARGVDAPLMTLAGAEIGVASTKAFTAQLAVLACLSLALARGKGKMGEEEMARHCIELAKSPSLIEKALAGYQSIEQEASQIKDARSILYIGRGQNYALAMEGALKLKEISYIHAEGYAAGELKHGPIALVDGKVPVIVLAPSDRNFEKTLSNVQEVAARQGQLYIFSDQKGCKRIADHSRACFAMPEVSFINAALVYAVPVQMLAYTMAVARGTDVDRPRNLAKSVTVE